MSLLCAALLTFSGLVAGGEAPRRLGHVVIPDLRGTLGRVEQAAAVVAPGTLAPGMLIAGLGAQLGDPGLAALGPGPVVLLLRSGAPPAGAPSVSAFVPTSNPEPYEKALTAMGWTVTRAPGLVVGTSAKAPPPATDEYRRIEAEPFTGDLRLSLSAAEVMEAYGPVLRSALGAMSAGLAGASATRSKSGTPSPAVARVLQLEMSALLMLMEQTDTVVSDVSLQPDAVVSETVIGARTGSALAELASHPPAGATTATAVLSRPALMTAAYQLDSGRAVAFAGDLLRRAAAEPRTAMLATAELQSMIDLWGRAFTGEAAVGVRGTSSSPLLMESLMKVRDEAAALAFFEKAAALAAPGGPWHGLYAEMGMPMTVALQKNVRRHAGAAVHRFQMKIDAARLPAEQRASVGLFVRDMELALKRGHLVMAQDPRALDALMDRLTAAPAPAAPLKSASVLGEGAHVYVDYDVFGLMRSLSSVMPTGGKPNPFAGLPPTDGHPLLYAVWLADEHLRVKAKLPLQPLADMMKVFKKAEAPKKVAGSAPAAAAPEGGR